MDNTEPQDIKNYGVLQWNYAEDITDIEENNDVDIKDNGDDEELCILEQIFPPREWTCENSERVVRTWRQIISKEMPFRSDVCKMIDSLRSCERYFKVKSKGLCDTRSALYSLFFDEILRQVVIVDENLGSLLYRIRNEFKSVIYIYKIMLEKAIVCTNMRSDLMTLDAELIGRVEQLSSANQRLTMHCKYASQSYLTAKEKKQSIENDKYHKKMEEVHAVQMSYLKRSIEQLKEQMIVMTPLKEVT